jgi:hypothetical protein
MVTIPESVQMKPTDLRGILQYIPRFREKVFVIAIDGAIITNENFGNILLDVAVLRSLNIRAVIVHGASAQIRQLAEQQGVKPSDLDGAGVTDESTLKLALTASNRLTHEILEGLSANDLRAVSTNGPTLHRQGGACGRGAVSESPRAGSDSGGAASGLRWGRKDVSGEFGSHGGGSGGGIESQQAAVYHDFGRALL